jgi:hypothetical protein
MWKIYENEKSKTFHAGFEIYMVWYSSCNILKTDVFNVE